MVAGAVLALLLLNIVVVHVHVEPHGREVLMPQQLLEREGVVAQLEVADREGVAEDVRADTLAGDASPLAQAREEQRHAVLGERGARLGQEEVILARAAPLGQFLLVGPVLIQVVEQIAQAVLAQGDPAFLRSFALHGEDTAPAVEVAEAQPAQFRDADAGVVEHPQDGSVAHRRALGDGAGLVGRGTGQQQPFELLGIDGLDERLAHFGEDHPVEGIGCEQAAMHQPVEEGTGRAGVGLDGALAAHLAPAARAGAQVGEPAADVGCVHLPDQDDAALLFQVGTQQPQGGAVPLEGLVAVIATGMVLQVVVDGADQGGFGTAFPRFLLATLLSLY